jgi:dienelactone hydrolase
MAPLGLARSRARDARHRRALAALLAVVLAAGGPSLAVSAATLPVAASLFGIAGGAPGEEILRIPVNEPRGFGNPGAFLEATLFRPPGAGPFPLAVLSHGSPREPDRRVGRQRFEPQSRWFVARGFAVVVPMRRGYAGSDGERAEGYGGCPEPDFRRAGLEAAKDIGAATRFVAARPDVDPGRIVLVGHSAGGFGSLALASQRPAGVLGVVNFAGGRGSVASGENCAPRRLVEAMGSYGRTTAVPTLWLYAENDLFFGPSLAREMHAAFRRGGGAAELLVLPSFGSDGHHLFTLDTGIPHWAPAVDRFLATLGFRSA